MSAEFEVIVCGALLKSASSVLLGFYLLSPLLPKAAPVKRPTLLLGPFHGLPACQLIPSIPGKGVCADASARLPPATVNVARTHDYPGHIACDSKSQSEVVVPIVVPKRRIAGFSEADKDMPAAWQGRGDGDDAIIGVLDIDCEATDGFDEDDVRGLERVVKLLADACDW